MYNKKRLKNMSKENDQINIPVLSSTSVNLGALHILHV